MIDNEIAEWIIAHIIWAIYMRYPRDEFDEILVLLAEQIAEDRDGSVEFFGRYLGLLK